MGLLRTLLALSVVFSHSPWNDGVVLVGGKVAVQLFYVISGFLITHILRTNKSYANPLRFYTNRALRIYPIYYSVAALTLILLAVGNPTFFDRYEAFGSSARWFLITSNALLFGQDWIMFLGQHGGAIHFALNYADSDPPLYRGLLVPQAWTLGVELTFYAIAPFVVRSVRKIWALFALSLLVRAYLYHLGLASSDPWSFRFFPAELSLFLLGSLANIYLLPLWRRALTRAGSAHLPRIATAILAALIAIYFLLPVGEGVRLTVLITVFAFLLPLTFIYQAGSSMDRLVGELSYPIYIGHMIAIWGVNTAMKRLEYRPDSLTISIMNVVIAVAFAMVLNRWIGRPVERARAYVKK